MVQLIIILVDRHVVFKNNKSFPPHRGQAHNFSNNVVKVDTSRITCNAEGFLLFASSSFSSSSSEDDKVSCMYSESEDD
jgi:hypothetical protein